MLKANELCSKLHADGVIALGDFNARHHLWGDHQINSYGQQLTNCVDFAKFSIKSSGNPMFLSKNGSSCIDLAITSNSIIDRFSDCYTDDHVLLYSGAPLRGHVPLLCGIRSNRYTKSESTSVDLNSMNWSLWSAILDQSLRDTTFPKDANEAWNCFIASIRDATKKSSCTKTVSDHSKPYWTPNLTMLCKSMRKARKLYQLRNTDKNVEVYTSAESSFDEARKAACSDFLIKKTTNLNTAQCREFWPNFKRVFSDKTNRQIGPLVNVSGDYLLNDCDMEEELYDTFFKSKHIVNNSSDFDKKFGRDIESRFDEISKYNNSVNSLLEKSNNSQVSYCDNVILGEPITILEYKQALRLVTGKSSNSLDNTGFHPSMWQHVGVVALA